MKTSCIRSLAIIALFIGMSVNSEARFRTLLGTGAKSSKTLLKEGDEFFKQYKFREASVSYQEALKEATDKKMYITQKLAKTYLMLFEYQNAAQWYGKLMEYSSDVTGLDIAEYISVLKNLEMYDKAIEICDLHASKIRLAGLSPEDIRQSCEWAKKHLHDEKKYDLFPTNLQTQGVFLGADFYNSGMMYACVSKDAAKTTYSDLRYVKMMDSVTFSAPENLAGKLNNGSNDAQPSITMDGKTLYFTKNTTDVASYNPKKGNRPEINMEGISPLNLYVSVNVNGEWSAPKRLSFASNEYSCAYPFIDADNKTLYFASNRAGGFGGFDIYKSVLENDTVFSTPKNLGREVNSAGDDFSPRVHGRKLYYASRGKGGFGGADLFVCDLNAAGEAGSATNMGLPFNSSKDDFCILFKNEKDGYLASNRESERGYDKLYYFKEIPPPFDTISGIVADRITNAGIPGVDVKLYEIRNKDSVLVNTTLTDSTGYWMFVVDPTKNYVVKINMKDYYEKRYVVPSHKKPKERREAVAALRNVSLSPMVKKNNIVKINNIYFDFNKANIRNDSYAILNNLLGFLNENPQAKIELSAHTDAAGNDKYNMKLSDNRAISCYEYLIGNGIDKSRITPKGYGETKLLNDCKDARKCSDAENQLNRRVEVKFL